MANPLRTTDTRITFFDRCFKDREGRVALAAKPNLPIVVWVAARLLAWPLQGSGEHFISLIGDGAILLWALLEVFQGVNYFRRALGLVVLAVALMSLAT